MNDHSAPEFHDIVLVGCGPGGAEFLTDAARQAVVNAEVVVGAARLVELFPQRPVEVVTVGADIDAAVRRVDELQAAGRRVAVLVTGDCGVYSLAQRVAQRCGRNRCRFIPGISSIQLAFARLALDWADARILSAHGRTPQATVEELAACDKVAVLGGTAEALQWTARMAEALQASHVTWLCENLSLPEERVRQVTAAELAAGEVASLAIVLFLRKGNFS